jgi:hypothetical protein
VSGFDQHHRLSATNVGYWGPIKDLDTSCETIG